MKRYILNTTVSVGLGLLLAPFAALAADDLTIMDTSGIARKVEQVDGVSTVRFNVDVPDGYQGTPTVALLANGSSTPIVVPVVGGVAEFSGLAPGVYTVSSEVAGLTFGEIAVETAALTATGAGAGAGAGLAIGSTAGTIAGVGALGGAIAVGASQANDDDNDDPVSPF